MASTSTQSTPLPLASVAPACSPYLQHLALIVRVLEHMGDQFQGFADLVPADLQDGVDEERIAEGIRAAAGPVADYGRRCMTLDGLSTSAYRDNAAQLEREHVYPSLLVLREIILAINAEEQARAVAHADRRASASRSR